ncbi:isatin hydrolase-like [Physella acuta]|uniref:isatin hydrolase-like n=1 Tax=Physella acuta TaxID=109671 RepID=UPI0027DDF569|nr:isatin hydrolase-like [Physella acuta]
MVSAGPKMASVCLALTLFVSGTLASCRPDSVIDMSHPLDSHALLWPGDDAAFNFTILTRGQTPEGFWLELNKFTTPEHVGTHLDAPSHFSEGHWRVDQIPPARLVGPGIVVDARPQVANNPDYRLTVADLTRWEELHGRIPDRAIVFMWTGWDTRYPDPFATFNTPTPQNSSTFHFPGYHPDAVRWLLDDRDLGMLAIDTPSNDYGQTRVFDVHQMIGRANVMGLENVNRIGQLPVRGATIVVAPVKLTDGSGGPVRILAMQCGSGNTGSRLLPFWHIW